MCGQIKHGVLPTFRPVASKYVWKGLLVRLQHRNRHISLFIEAVMVAVLREITFGSCAPNTQKLRHNRNRNPAF